MFITIFSWLYWRTLVAPIALGESDLYEYFLPIFLSPFTTRSVRRPFLSLAGKFSR